MIEGKRVSEAGFKYIGTPYSKMDCQAFVEQCLRDCGINKDLAGSNAWYREVAKNGVIMTPEQCMDELNGIPAGAFLFIWADDGGEPSKYHGDDMGNASHIGLVTGRGQGAIHSSQSRGQVCESSFKNKSISGGWNRVGLWNQIAYDYGNGAPAADDSDTGFPVSPGWHPTIRRGDKGTDVAYCQAILMQLGYDLGTYGADGDFGRRTEAAVRSFQADHGLVVDGIVGPMTWDALESVEPDPAQEPGTTMYYTVTIRHLTEYDAEALKARYDGAVTIEKE